MKYFFVFIIVITIFSSSPLTVQAQSKATTKNLPDLQAVKKASEDFILAFNNLDWEKFRYSFSDEATVFFPFRQIPRRASGRTEVEMFFKKIFDELKKRKSEPPYQNIIPKDTEIQMLGKVAILTFHLGGNDSLGRRTLVFNKQKGKWLIIHMHASIFTQAEAAK